MDRIEKAIKNYVAKIKDLLQDPCEEFHLLDKRGGIYSEWVDYGLYELLKDLGVSQSDYDYWFSMFDTFLNEAGIYFYDNHYYLGMIERGLKK